MTSLTDESGQKFAPSLGDGDLLWEAYVKNEAPVVELHQRIVGEGKTLDEHSFKEILDELADRHHDRRMFFEWAIAQDHPKLDDFVDSFTRSEKMENDIIHTRPDLLKEMDVSFLPEKWPDSFKENVRENIKASHFSSRDYVEPVEPDLVAG